MLLPPESWRLTTTLNVPAAVGVPLIAMVLPLRAADRPAGRPLTVRLLYAMGRVLLLALTIILVRRGAGKDDGLTALLVIAFAFTVQLAVSIVTRPRSR